MDVAGALEAATPHSARLFAPVTASAEAIGRTKAIIERFLENIPEEVCVLELRRALDELP